MAEAPEDSDAAAREAGELWPTEPPPLPQAPKPPALAAKADDLEAIRSAVVDAAAISAGLWLSYLLVLFYLLIATGGVTHRDLFLANTIKLPFLGVELPLEGFFMLGPALFLVVHAYVLLHFVLLSSKARILDTQLRAQIDDPELRTRLRRQLPINIFVQFLAGPREARGGLMGFLLRLISWISLVAGPVALLVFFQLQFLPYHDIWITTWQRIAVVIDLVLLWLLWPTILHGEAQQDVLAAHQSRPGLVLVLASISLMSALLVFTIATFPGEWLDGNLPALRFPLVLAATPNSQTSLHELLVAGKVDPIARKPTSLWSNSLVLPGFDVIDHARFDTEAKIVAAPEMASLRGRHLQGAVLIGAVLRKVDFTAADLQKALVSEAQLQSAVLDYAQLQDAWLDHAQLQGASLDEARLQNATLADAKLQGASLRKAQLQGAFLPRAQLQGASLIDAQLQGASLVRAQLQGASLDRAQLQVARLIEAQLQGASLDGARLQGALLDRAQLQGASLARAELRGASLLKAFVWRADARQANAGEARVEQVYSGPKRPCRPDIGGMVIETVCDWDDTLENLKRLFEDHVPASVRRTAVLALLERRLDATKPLDGEEEMAKHWLELQGTSPDNEKLAELWRQIGCAPDGAPFVLAGLINNIWSPTFRSDFGKDRVQARKFAAEFLKEDCVGARGLSDDTRKELIKLRDATPQTSAKPNAQPAKP